MPGPAARSGSRVPGEGRYHARVSSSEPIDAPAVAEDPARVGLERSDDGEGDTRPAPGVLAAPSGNEVRRAAVKAKLFPEFEAPRIGRYAVLEILGEGGMGTVYACFDDQLDRRVAVKLIRGVADEHARLRVLREAQAMAKLSHPNVVPVFEVGTHDEQLFVAMEFVRGVALQQWQRSGHPWRDVLEAYLQAGRGLAAAHAVGIVHRDFKPHNAMIGEDGRVRVLDFGLAARRDAPAQHDATPPTAGLQALDTALTQTGAVMGTPAYMAPEQLAGAAVDHRADQFSFCVSLWEGLFGGRPFAGVSITELTSRIDAGELVEPPRSDVPVALRRVLERGLRADRNERWPDLPSLLEELARHDVDPARARRRRRLALGLGLGMPGLVVGGWVTESWIDDARRRGCETEAADRARSLWSDETEAALREALLATGAPIAQTTALRVLPALAVYVGTWEAATADTCIAARVARTLADDDHDRASWCLEQRALAFGATRDALLAVDSAVINGAITMATGIASVDACREPELLRRLPAPPGAAQREAVTEIHRELAEARALDAAGKFEPGLVIAEATLARASELGHRELLADARLTVGGLQSSAGAFESAARTLEDAYFDAVAAHDHASALAACSSLVYLTGERLDQHAVAEHWGRLGWAAVDELGLPPDHPDVASLSSELAGVARDKADYPKALELQQRALAIRTAVFGEQHPAVAADLTNIAIIRFYMGDGEQAKELQQRALATREAAFGSDHPNTAQAVDTLGSFHFALGDNEGAKALYLRALKLRERVLRPDHPDLASTLTNLGNACVATGDTANGVAHNRRALAIRERAGADSLEVGESLNNLAIALTRAGEFDEAGALLRRAIEIKTKRLGADHPTVANSWSSLGAVHSALRERDAAVDAYRNALQIKQARLGAEHPEVAAELSNLGTALLAVGSYAEARTLGERALAIRERVFGSEHAQVAQSLHLLGLVDLESGDPAAAVRGLERALGLYATHQSDPHDQASAQLGLARALVSTHGDLARALELARAAARTYRAAGASKAEALAEAEAWLAAHG